jgi:hypothetical protein
MSSDATKTLVEWVFVAIDTTALVSTAAVSIGQGVGFARFLMGGPLTKLIEIC